MSSSRLVTGAIGLVLACGTGAALAQDTYPSKVIRIVAPATGGGSDVVGRMIAPGLAASLGQQVIIDNRGAIASEIVAKAPPDGYTLLVNGSPLWLLPVIRPGTPWDAPRDFAPITLAGFSANLLVAHPSFPPNNVKELIEYARRNPGKVNYGSSGNGTSVHLAMELFKSMTKTYMLHIPYKGSAPVVTDLIAGQVDVMFDNMPNVIGHVRAGKMKPLAVTTAQRSPQAPEIPTLAEAGVPGYEQTAWFGVLAPAGTPREIVLKLHGEITKLLNTAEVKERFAKQGVEVRTTTPEAFGDFVKSEVERWGKVIREAGIKAD